MDGDRGCFPVSRFLKPKCFLPKSAKQGGLTVHIRLISGQLGCSRFRARVTKVRVCLGLALWLELGLGLGLNC